MVVPKPPPSLANSVAPHTIQISTRIYTGKFPNPETSRRLSWGHSSNRRFHMMPAISIIPTSLDHDFSTWTQQPSHRNAPQGASTLLASETDDDEENFYDCLMPSDSFFPFSTALAPRPMRMG
ncbi:hypothetical protein ABW19_dt0205282 [Dactylella cylindrospora]|nr:hypothetical protein ABW19_dt0205282 [Dactylella cylindrospora]